MQQAAFERAKQNGLLFNCYSGLLLIGIYNIQGMKINKCKKMIAQPQPCYHKKKKTGSRSLPEKKAHND